jgi:hypothetical protein
MTVNPDEPALERFDDALAETQRAERADRDADLEREQRTDQRIVDALSRHSTDGDGRA